MTLSASHSYCQNKPRHSGAPWYISGSIHIFQQIYGVLKSAFLWMFSTDKHLLIICVALSVLSLSLNWKSSIFTLGGPHDSLRYIGMAETILKGEWLGVYNHMTLIRSPVYSLALVLNSLAGWRLHVFQHSIYLTSVLLLVRRPYTYP